MQEGWAQVHFFFSFKGFVFWGFGGFGGLGGCLVVFVWGFGWQQPLVEGLGRGDMAESFSEWEFSGEVCMEGV